MSKKYLLNPALNSKASNSLDILPKQSQEFTNKQYWNQFFQRLDNKAFEWYGKTEDIFPVISQSLHSKSKILMIGSGNSNLSSDLYDSGYHDITNVDYSEVAVEEMKRKNQTTRSMMKWDLGDATDLHGLYTNESFDVVIDKGTLDAIFSENTPELRQKTLQMFQEIERVLSNSDGMYILITLAQDFILELLLEHFTHPQQSSHTRSSWNCEIYYLNKIFTSAPNSSSSSSSSSSSAKGGNSSPLQPFLFKFTKRHASTVFHKFQNPSDSTNSTSLSLASSQSAVAKVYMDAMGNDDGTGKFIPIQQITSYIQHIQEFYLLKHSLSSFEIGKFETLHFWSTKDNQSNAKNDGNTLTQSDATATIPRYTLYILDASAQGKLSMAVFIIPYGRESDYQFTNKDGLLDIAFQANCQRLIAVSCNRPYPYPEMATLQDELSPLILSMRLSKMTEDEVIPYMAVNQDNSWEVIAQGESKLSGIYIVEEQSDENDEDEDNKNNRTGVYRRLIFLQNQQFVQTEVHLISPKPITPAVTSNKKNGKSKAKASTTETIVATSTSPSALVFDYSYLDDHHKGFLLSLCLSNSLINSVTRPLASVVDRRNHDGTCLVIGLGGGSLPMIFQKYYPSLSMTIVEIDEVVYDVAKEYFSLSLNPALHTVVIEEGVSFIQRVSTTSTSAVEDATSKLSLADGTSKEEQKEEKIPMISLPLQYDVIVIDVDCKDPSLGLSAPPKEFITNDTLRSLYSLLSPQRGMLLINTVARNKAQLNTFIDRLKIIFNVSPNEEVSSAALTRAAEKGGADQECEGKIIQLQASSENVNLCIICLKNGFMPFVGASADNGGSKKKNKSKSNQNSNSKASFTKNQLEIKLQVSVEQSLQQVLSVSLSIILVLLPHSCCSSYLV